MAGAVEALCFLSIEYFPYQPNIAIQVFVMEN